MARHHYETLQQVFDDAYRGLAAQGFRRSQTNMESCAYRGDDNRRCAIGHCIPDDLYDPVIEGAVISSPFGRRPEAVTLFDGLFGTINRGSLSELQFHHDCWPVPEDMRNALHNWARGEGLTIPSIEGAA
jgi:hypothetical protein